MWVAMKVLRGQEKCVAECDSLRTAEATQYILEAQQHYGV
jgi:hypothetical protein